MRSLFLGALAALSCYIFDSCNESTIIGKDLIPPNDQIITANTDTFTIRASTVREDSVFATNLLFNPVGSLEDPVFGKSYAALFAEARLPTNDLNLRDSTEALILDSIVLTLDYAALYGDEEAMHSFEVYRMTEQIQPATEYYSDQLFSFDPVPIGSKKNFIPRLDDSIPIYDSKVAPHLRIRLNDALGWEFLSRSGTPSFSNDSSFLDFFSGFYLVPDTTVFSKSYITFDPTSLLSRIELYYQRGDTDSLRIDFPITDDSRTAAHYSQNFRGAEVASYLDDPMPETDSILFVQSLGGLKARIELPHIEELGEVAVNKAEISFRLTGGIQSDTVFPAPAQMYLIKEDSLGGNEFILILREEEVYISLIDQFEGDDHYGGAKEVVNTPSGREITEYRINISRYLQSVLTGEEENDALYLVSFPYFRIPNRAIVGSPHHPDEDYRMKLYITYTLIN